MLSMHLGRDGALRSVLLTMTLMRGVGGRLVLDNVVGSSKVVLYTSCGFREAKGTERDHLRFMKQNIMC